jgi:hypothetical protein
MVSRLVRSDYRDVGRRVVNEVSYGHCKPLNREVFSIAETFEVKIIIFWDVTLCSLLRCNRRFGGTYSLHFQSRRTFQQEPASKQVASKSIMESYRRRLLC